MKRLLVCIFILTASIFISSCSKKTETAFSTSSLVTLYDAEEDSKELSLPSQLWHKSNDCIAVVFGYGYNDSDFVTETKERLFARYGNYNENGRLLPLVFPEDFKRGSRTYITDLAHILEDKEVSALVILGAPEGTYAAIARLQDSYDGTLPFPVISLFSQDDVLGMEYSADFILDKRQKAQLNGIIEAQSDQEFVEEIPELLDRSVYLADISEEPFKKDEKLFDIVKMITGKAKISRYSDTETGLISINHFLLD